MCFSRPVLTGPLRAGVCPHFGSVVGFFTASEPPPGARADGCSRARAQRGLRPPEMAACPRPRARVAESVRSLAPALKRVVARAAKNAALLGQRPLSLGPRAASTHLGNVLSYGRLDRFIKANGALRNFTQCRNPRLVVALDQGINATGKLTSSLGGQNHQGKAIGDFFQAIFDGYASQRGPPMGMTKLRVSEQRTVKSRLSSLGIQRTLPGSFTQWLRQRAPSACPIGETLMSVRRDEGGELCHSAPSPSRTVPANLTTLDAMTLKYSCSLRWPCVFQTLQIVTGNHSLSRHA